MLGRNPLFPGKTFIHQLSLVFDVIGTPSPSDVRHIVNTEALAFLQSQRGKRKVAFSTLYPHAESSAWSLLDQTLAFAPSQRSTVDDILQSPYLRGVGTAPSLVFPPTSPDFCFPFENPDITRHELKQLLLGEISSFRRERSGASGGSGGISSRVKSQNNAEEKEEDAEAADKRSKSARRGDAADHQRERERHPSRRGSMRRAEDKDEAPAVPARHQHDVDDNMCQHNHNDSQANRNVPSYLRPTGHFRDRAASAPRPRPPAGARKAEAIAMRATQRSDAKDADDGVSVNSGSVASSAAPRPRKGNTTVVSITSRQQQQQPKSGCGLLGEEGSLAEGDETPRRSTEFQPGMVTARSLPVSQRQQPTNAPNIAATATRNNARIEEDMSAVRTSTMRNLLHLCDEMYRDETAAHLHAEGSEAKHESTATGTASVQPQPQPRANPSRHSDAAYYAHHAESKHDQQSTASAASASAYAEESKNLSSACWPEGMFSPHARKQAPRFPTVSHQNSSDVKESQESACGLAIDAKQSNSNGLASEPPAVSSMAAQPKESPARNYTGGSSSGRGGSGSKATAYDRGDPSSDSNRDEGDNDEDDGLSPAPRSPLRKSLLQTYTSPTRLTSSQPSSSPMQRSPAARSKVAQATEHLHCQPRPQLTSSLSEKLLERARLLASGHTSASAHPVAKPPSETVETLYQQQRLHQSGCEAGTDDDSFMGDYSSTVHPTSVGGPSAVPRYESQRNRGIADNDATAEEREHDRAAAARNAGNAPPPPLAATGAVGESKQQRKFTVAKSPKFSLMSWQKRRDEQREAEERLAAQLLEDSKRKSLGKTTATKPAANGNYFGYQAPKRSDSAPRQRR